MIRLYLKNYRLAELVELYNAISLARAAVTSEASSNSVKDLDETLVYLSGFIDAKGDIIK